ncbi:MAG: hypothetical protein M9894_14810 [Planctomycetes bacterium]|nr:hypothetical protein [Planctomycetota bacterium]
MDDSDADVAEIDKITSSWVVDDRPTKFPPRGPTHVYVSKVPAALACVNRAAKDPDWLKDPDALYEIKLRAMLICARLGWARECSTGFQVGKFMFHLPVAIDCARGDATEYRNLDPSKFDDPDAALAVLEQFIERHPLTPEEEQLVAEYEEMQEARFLDRMAFDDEDEDACWDDEDSWDDDL